MILMPILKASILPSLAALVVLATPPAHGHRFIPAELAASANKPIVVEVTNQDSTPAEFESKTLRVEKVVAGGASIKVQIRALAPGRYRFFDDYREATTEGFLIVQ